MTIALQDLKSTFSLDSNPLKAGAKLAVAGVAAVVAGITIAVKATMDWAKDLDSLGDVMDGTTDGLAALGFVARKSGVGVDAVAKANVLLNKSLLKSNGTLDVAGKKLKEYGIDVKDANGNVKDSVQLTDEIAQKYAELGTQQERVNFLTEIYGKSGAQMVDFFDTLVAEGGIDKVTQKVKKFGLAVDPARYEKFNRNLEELKLIGLGLAVSFTEKVMPILEGFLNWFGQAADNPKFRMFADAIGAGIASIPTLLQQIAQHPAFQALISAFQQIGEKVSAFIDKVVVKIQAWVQDNLPLIQEFGRVMMDVWMNNVLPAVVQAWGGIEPILTGIIDLVLGLAKIVMQVATGDWKGAWTTLKETAVKVFNALVDGVAGIIQAVLTLFGTSVPEIAAKLVEWKNSISTKLGEIAKTFEQKVGGWIRKAVDALNSGKQALLDVVTGIKDDINKILKKIITAFTITIKLPSWLGGGGGGGSSGSGTPNTTNTQHVPGSGRATGGATLAGKAYNVLELGKSEMFTPFTAGRIDPMKSGNEVTLSRRSIDDLADRLGVVIPAAVVREMNNQ